MSKPACLLLAIVILAAAVAAAESQADSRLPAEVVRYSGGGAAALDARVTWALAEAGKAADAGGFWAGWSIRRLMGENSMIGSFDGGRSVHRPTIEEILAGKTSLGNPADRAPDVRRTAKEVLDGLEHPAKSEKKVEKNVGIFLSYQPGRPPVLKRVELSNLDLSFDFKGRPLYWLGEAPDSESLGLVKKLYAEARTDEAKKGLVAAAGLHGSPALALPFLEKVLIGSDPDEVRKDAAFWISQQDAAAALRILVRAAETDKSREVREGAVFGISEVELPQAADELITLARGAAMPDVKKQAIFWLSQIASKKAAPALEEFAEKGEGLEVQEQAVFALSELPNGEGLDALIKLAKTHPDGRIRKKAIFWLGESGDPRALQTLIEIVRGRTKSS